MHDWILLPNEEHFKGFDSKYIRNVGKPDSYPCFGQYHFRHCDNGPDEHIWTFLTPDDLKDLGERLAEYLADG